MGLKQRIARRLKHWFRWNVMSDGWYHCPFCDGKLIWGGDEDVDDPPGYATNFTCERCKRIIVVFNEF